ncbi:Myb protein [Thalictrum thalictroides]|uniref:Myb protein n=1 Tax=Thalictrum thalictroides TaxID=46969 RepID=A0A7J6V149_THATH|nr:Myb protein [Thalictrum thalictroides]
MCMNELSCQPTFPLGRPMDPIRPMVGGEFVLAEPSEGGGLVHDYQYCNQYRLNGMLSNFDSDESIIHLSFVLLNMFVYGNSNRDVVGSMSDFRKNGMNTFQYESCSDLHLNTENMARTEDRSQILLDSMKNVVHAHAHADTGGFGSSNDQFPCVNEDNRFNEEARQMTEKNNGKAHKKSSGSNNRGQWTAEEDSKLIRLMHKHKNSRKLWATVSRSMDGSRLGKQCRERWNNHLKPGIDKNKKWTEDEDRAIVDGHKKYRNRWADIAKAIPGRTEISVKNRWNNTCKRKLSAEGKKRQSNRPLPSATLQQYIISINKNSSGTTNNFQEEPTSSYYIPVLADNLEVPIPPADQGNEGVVYPNLPFDLDMSMCDEEMFKILN